MENEVMIPAEQEPTRDSFLDGFDGAVDNAASGETAPDQQIEAQTAESQPQEGADPPVTGENAGSEQPTQETTGEGGTDGGQPQPVADAPKVWTLRYMDEAKTVGEADMVVLAQKGLDYDRIRNKYDESKPVMELFGTFAKQAGMSIQDYVAHIRTQAKQAAGMSADEARRTVELENREAAVAMQEAAEAARQSAANQAQTAQQAAEARRRADIAEFQQTFPDVAKDPQSIPPEVWADVRAGSTLVAAYGKYALTMFQQARQTAAHNAAAATQNQVNAGRSTGSMKSAGEGSKGCDPFLEGFGS